MMKKSNFVALIFGIIGAICFALGMCMCLIPEWNLFNRGVVTGIIGLVILLATFILWRRMENKAPIQLSKKTVGCVVVGVIGALVFGVGLCLCLTGERMMLGVVVGLVGIVILLMLIPLTKGLHD